MKFYTRMPEKLIPFYKQELTMARRYLLTDLRISWRHLLCAIISPDFVPPIIVDLEVQMGYKTEQNIYN